MPETTVPAPRRAPLSVPANVALWIVQILLALLFLFAGGMKLVMPIAAMTKDMPMPGAFLRFLGVAEVLGGLGLVLPGMTRRFLFLTPMAAAGLLVIMIGAVVITATHGGFGMAIMPLVVGVLCAVVALARRPRA